MINFKSDTKRDLLFLSSIVIVLMVLSSFQVLNNQTSVQHKDVNSDSQTSVLSKLNSLTEISPLFIKGDADLMNQAGLFGWPGSGTSTNPVIIDSVSIQQPALTLLEIRDVSLYVTIQNSVFNGISGVNDGLYFYNVTHVYVVGNTIKNTDNPVAFINSPGAILSTNTIINGNSKMRVESSDNVIVKNNNVQNVPSGLEFYHSSQGSIDNNVFVKSGLAFFSYGSVSSMIQSSVTNNTVNGLPLVFKQSDWVGGSISGPAGQVILINCTGFTISGLTITDTAHAIGVYYSLQITVTNNVLKQNDFGVYLLSTNGSSMITSNTVEYSSGYGGIYSYLSNGNLIDSNQLMNNYIGIYMLGSDSNSVTNNYVKDSTKSGMYLYGGNDYNKINNNELTTNLNGIILVSSTNNFVETNYIHDNFESGIELWDSTDNTVNNNSLAYNNMEGIVFVRSPSNTITNNALVHEGFYLTSEYSNLYLQTYVINNTVDGRKIEFLQNQVGATVSKDDIGQVILINCTDIRVYGMYFYNVTSGIQIVGGSGTVLNGFMVQNNVINNSRWGIIIHYSKGLTIDSNNITETVKESMRMFTTNSTVVNNNILDQGLNLDGFDFASYDNQVTNNKVQGKQLFFLKNTGSLSILPSANAGQVIFVNVTNGAILGQNIVSVDVPITVVYSDHITVKDNVLDDCKNTCMNIRSTNHSSYINNNLLNAGYRAFRLIIATDSIVNNNVVSNSYWEGTYFSNINNTVFDGNVFKKNGYTGMAFWGIGDNDTITNNQMISNGVLNDPNYQGDGLGIYRPFSNGVIANNTMSTNVQSGLTVWPAYDTVIKGNSVHDNGYYGIKIYNSNNLQLNENDVYSNKFDGIWSKNSRNLELSTNIVDQNGWNGFHSVSTSTGSATLTGGFYYILDENTFKANQFQGVYLEHASYKASLTCNEFYSNNVAYTTSFPQVSDSGIDVSGMLSTINKNFYDDHTSPDNNNNGIVDTPYLIAGSAFNKDNNPLVVPCGTTTTTTLPTISASISATLSPVTSLSASSTSLDFGSSFALFSLALVSLIASLRRRNKGNK